MPLAFLQLTTPVLILCRSPSHSLVARPSGSCTPVHKWSAPSSIGVAQCMAPPSCAPRGCHVCSARHLRTCATAFIGTIPPVTIGPGAYQRINFPKVCANQLLLPSPSLLACSLSFEEVLSSSISSSSFTGTSALIARRFALLPAAPAPSSSCTLRFCRATCLSSPAAACAADCTPRPRFGSLAEPSAPAPA